jgi:hypothetical protein
MAVKRPDMIGNKFAVGHRGKSCEPGCTCKKHHRPRMRILTTTNVQISNFCVLLVMLSIMVNRGHMVDKLIEVIAVAALGFAVGSGIYWYGYWMGKK